MNSIETSSYVYAIGRIEPRAPEQSVRRELERASGEAARVAQGSTDSELLQSVLQDPANRYLVRQLCWVMSIEGQDTYLVHPRDPLDLDLLVEAVRNRPGRGDMDVVVGVRGPMAPPEACNGLQVPLVIADQIYSFTREQLLQAIPRPDGADENTFAAAAGEVLDRFLQVADNAGATDEHRALNYLSVRYPEVYATVADGFLRNFSLYGVEVYPSALSGIRRIMDVVITLAHRERTVRERYVVRVDVTEEFPFLESPLERYYDRS